MLLDDLDVGCQQVVVVIKGVCKTKTYKSKTYNRYNYSI